MPTIQGGCEMHVSSTPIKKSMRVATKRITRRRTVIIHSWHVFSYVRLYFDEDATRYTKKYISTTLLPPSSSLPLST